MSDEQQEAAEQERSEDKVMIARLERLADEDSNDRLSAGRARGREWVRNEATPRQLRRLEKAVQEIDGRGGGETVDFVRIHNSGNNNGHGAALDGVLECDAGEIVDQGIEDEDYVIGFIEAALGGWAFAQAHSEKLSDC